MQIVDTNISFFTTVGIAVGVLGFLFIRNCFRKRKDGGSRPVVAQDLRVFPPGPGMPVAFPPPTPEPGPNGQMAQTFPRVADQLEALARKVQGEGGYGAPAPRPFGGAGAGGYNNNNNNNNSRSIVSYFPAPEDKVARTHPGLANQLAAIASRVANEDGSGRAAVPPVPLRPGQPALQSRTYSPAMPPEPMPTMMMNRGPTSSFGSEMSSSLESMTQLSRESVRQIGFQHPVNRWVHIKQGPGGVGPAPSQPPPMPSPLNNANGGGGGMSRPPGPQMAAYDVPRGGGGVAAYDMGRY